MSHVTPIEIGRNRRGQFVEGNPGGPGRPPGARNKLGEQFLGALADDFERNGREAIEAARQADPVAYLRMIASLMPKALEAHLTASVSFRDALEELEERVRPHRVTGRSE